MKRIYEANGAYTDEFCKLFIKENLEEKLQELLEPYINNLLENGYQYFDINQFLCNKSESLSFYLDIDYKLKNKKENEFPIPLDFDDGLEPNF